MDAVLDLDPDVDADGFSNHRERKHTPEKSNFCCFTGKAGDLPTDWECCSI
jgi:hypothetical protein